MRLREPKQCSCGRTHEIIGREAAPKQLDSNDDLAGTYWNCVCNSTLFAPPNAFIANECACDDCTRASKDCECACDPGPDECSGCRESRLAHDETCFEIDCALGRR